MVSSYFLGFWVIVSMIIMGFNKGLIERKKAVESQYENGPEISPIFSYFWTISIKIFSVLCFCA